MKSIYTYCIFLCSQYLKCRILLV